jgi:hypothetical protein
MSWSSKWIQRGPQSEPVRETVGVDSRCPHERFRVSGERLGEDETAKLDFRHGLRRPIATSRSPFGTYVVPAEF